MEGMGGGSRSGISARLKDVLKALTFDREAENGCIDDTAIVIALNELCEIVVTSSEELLATSLSPEPFAKALLNCCNLEHNPELMLLAVRDDVHGDFAKHAGRHSAARRSAHVVSKALRHRIHRRRRPPPRLKNLLEDITLKSRRSRCVDGGFGALGFLRRRHARRIDANGFERVLGISNEVLIARCRRRYSNAPLFARSRRSKSCHFSVQLLGLFVGES